MWKDSSKLFFDIVHASLKGIQHTLKTKRYIRAEIGSVMHVLPKNADRTNVLVPVFLKIETRPDQYGFRFYVRFRLGLGLKDAKR